MNQFYLEKDQKMSGAGKGDTYRKVDKKRFDTSYESIFGKKDIMDFQKSRKYSGNSKPQSLDK
ncbi:MAG: hypothetical protein GXY77_08360 [Fibrobacter sp.]|nr:hypothetical protein [Fibrobacter sp.]